MIHAVNPFGFSHLKRTNEDNIDLNRNFNDFSTPYPDNPVYEEVHDLLVPKDLAALTGERGAAYGGVMCAPSRASVIPACRADRTSIRTLELLLPSVPSGPAIILVAGVITPASLLFGNRGAVRTRWCRPATASPDAGTWSLKCALARHDVARPADWDRFAAPIPGGREFFDPGGHGEAGGRGPGGGDDDRRAERRYACL